jgi:hypothetical protein
MLLDLPEECPTVEREEHKTRYRTLQQIGRQYATHPERFAVVNIWRPHSDWSYAAGALTDAPRLVRVQQKAPAA